MPVEEMYRVALWRTLVRPVMRAGFRALFHILAPVKVSGRKNLPPRPYLVAINHVSLYDPPFIMSFWPEALEVMGAMDVWKRKGQGILANLYGGIPVHRGEYDRRLFDRVVAVLRSGYPLLIAPEGGRSHVTGMQRAKPGAAYIVEQTGVPVIPVGIVGTTDDFWERASRGERPPLEMRIGRPIRLPAIEGKGSERRESRQRNADIVMGHIAGLLPEDYRGVYANQVITPSVETGK